jgi:YD repeat-containing protein
MSRNSIQVCFAVLVTLVFASSSRAQVATGTPPFGSFTNGTFDTVNLANLNVHFGIPILSKPGRGLAFHYVMDYESSIWTPTPVSGSTLWQPVNTNNWGWRAQSEALTGSVTVNATTGWCFFTDQGGQRYKISYPTTTYRGYTDPSGTFHSTYVVTTSGDSSCDVPVPPVYTGSQVAVDGSGYLLTVNEHSNPRIVVTTRSGVTIPNPGTSTGTITDTNGNQLTTSVNGSTTTFTDTLGLTALTVTTVSSSQTTYSYTAPSGAQAHYSFNYSQHSVQTNFGCSGIGEYPATAVWLLDTITLPDSTKYSFQYESTPGLSGKTTGRIASVTLPAGGTISYAYQGANNGITCADGTAATLQRTTPDGTWTYAHTEGSSWTTTATDPHGNRASLVFLGLYETSRITSQNINGTQTTLSTVKTCYNGSCSTGITLPITRITATLELPDTNGEQSQTDTFFNSLGLVTESDQYGFASGAPGPLLRKTLITYNTSLTNNILDHPSSVVIQDGGNLVGQKTYTYDEGQLSQNTGTPPQHVSVSGSRGNLTSLSTFYSATGSLTSHYSYYNTGTVNVATNVNGAQTTYNYGSGSCAYSFPDSVTLPMSLSRSTAYNCSGGVSVSQKDENGNTSYVNYASDPYFWRPNSVQDASGVLTTVTYTGANQIESALNFNGGSSTVDVLTTLDPLGRVLYTQQKQSPSSSNYDSAQRSYNGVNALFEVTMPYVGSAGQAAPNGTAGTAINYDALGRPTLIADGGGGTITRSYTKDDILQEIGPAPSGEQTKKMQLEYDSLGRPTKSCAIGNGATTLCGQNSGTAYGVTTLYSYTSAAGSRTTIATRGSQTRSQTFDALGRVISSTTPEGGSTTPGTTTYIYDTASSTCTGALAGFGIGNTAYGSVIEIIDNAGVHTCNGIDALGRVRLQFAWKGTGGITNCHNYIYGDVMVNPPFTILNAKGRIAAANVDFTCTGNSDVDEWFSYDQDGQVTDMWEKTPHSTQYYHSKATFFENGKVKTLQLVSPSLYTMTWGLDGEGRWNTLTDTTSGKALVAGATFFPAANPAFVTLTGTDKDSFTFDQNTGRMTQYVFTVGSSSMTGNLAWNPNGTVKQLAITDGFNSGGTQTCNFNPTVAPATGYDDLGRLVGVDCGSGQWGQTFSYDIYDNLGKSASFSGRIGTTWLPGYSATTNHCNGCTYDADGNVTGDGNNVYGWDGFSKLTWTATSGTPTCGSSGRCAVYDAFGRMVERSVGTTWYEQWFTQAGTVWMSGSTINYAYWPAPAGSRVLLYGNSTNYDYLHGDWLGNGRIDSNLTNHTVTTDQAYTPYGEIFDIFGSNVGQNEIFAMMNGNFAPGTTTPVMWDTPNRELSVVGRWLSPDPAGWGWNQYAYPTSPLNQIDPVGLSPFQYAPALDGSAFNQWLFELGLNFISSGTQTGVVTSTVLFGNVNIGQYQGVTLYLDGLSILSLSGSWGIGSAAAPTNNGTWQWIKNTARKIGNYIPVVCGGGVYNTGGLQIAGGAASVTVRKIQVADTREGYQSAPFGEINIGEGLQGGFGQALYSTGTENYLFGGVGLDLPLITEVSVTGFVARVEGDSLLSNSFGLDVDGGVSVLGGSAAVYVNTDSLTSCADHNFH